MLIRQDPLELASLADQLVSGAWAMMSQAERRTLIDAFCVGYILPPLSLGVPTVYRARRNDNSKLFTDLKQLLAPPAAVVRSAGRLNHVGESTLYLCGDPVTATFEVRAQLGDTVTIVACTMRPEKPPFCVAPIAMRSLRARPSLGPISELYRGGPLGFLPFREMLESRGLLDQWLRQEEVLGHLLTLLPSPDFEQSLYELTNGIRDHIVRHFPVFDGFTYPSVVSGLQSVNIALDKRWNDLEPIEVWVAEVTEEILFKGHGKVTLYHRPLIKIGTFGDDGVIEYSDTDKTFLTAIADFKQSYGMSAVPLGGKHPLLLKPYHRYRISYDFHKPRKVYDFSIG